MLYLIHIVKGFMKKMSEDHVGAYAAQASYFIILSFIPFIMLLTSLLKYTPLTETDIQDAIIMVSPSMFREFLLSIVDDVYNKYKSVTLVSVTAVTAIWSAARGILALSNGLNVIYRVNETRNYILMRIRAGFYTLLFVVAILISLILLVFGNSLQITISEYMPFLEDLSGFIISIRTVFSMCVLSLVFLIVYRFLPNRKAKLKSQIPGAVLTAAAWTVFSFGFSIYVDHAKGMSYMYGSLTTVILVMLWLYFCMYIIFTGAQINAYFEERFRKMHSEIAAWKASRGSKEDDENEEIEEDKEIEEDDERDKKEKKNRIKKVQES